MLSRQHGHWLRGCINILPDAHSIFLANGNGHMYERKLTAFAGYGCNPSTYLTGISDRWPIGPCMPVDHIMDGVAGAEISDGRLMSVHFYKGTWTPNWGP